MLFRSTGTGTILTYYRWYNGPWESNGYNTKMMLTCFQKNDAFTVSDITKGNGALTYPVGLLSTDEVVLAGGWNVSNSGYYLYSGQAWWAFSPYDSRDGADVRSVYSGGYAHDYDSVSSDFGVRPVLNLKPEAIKYGDGTLNNPYRLTESLDNSSSSESGGIDTGD